MNRRAFVLLLIGVAAFAYLATGWVVVAPGEVVVVRRLGRVLPRPWAPGLHWGWPLGLDRRDARPAPTRSAGLEVGLAGTPGPADEPGAGEYLTGDLNLLRARGVVQYRVADPVAFVLRAAEVEPLLLRLTESGLARALARRGIDGVLRASARRSPATSRPTWPRPSALHDLGIAILGVSLTDARPPTEVAPDFAAAQAARSERDRRLNEAKTYAATTLTAAAGRGPRHDRASPRLRRPHRRPGRRAAPAGSWPCSPRPTALAADRPPPLPRRPPRPAAEGQAEARADARRAGRPEHPGGGAGSLPAWCARSSA